MNVLRLVQFTDPHLYGSESETLRGVATLPALMQTVAQARSRDWPVDAILVTGDIVQDDPAGYTHFRRIFGSLGRPVYCLPGNHDDLAAMKRELNRPPFVLDSYVDLGPWRIVQLDSCIPGSAGGRLSERSLAELDAALSGAAGRHALVCMHHHPVSMNSRWLDEVGLSNANEFFRIIDRHQNVRAVLWGHVHQSFEGVRKGVRMLATPSTCAQFLPHSDDFALDPSPPAYRTLDLHPDGSIMTEVVWVETCVVGLPRSACSSAA